MLFIKINPFPIFLTWHLSRDTICFLFWSGCDLRGREICAHFSQGKEGEEAIQHEIDLRPRYGQI